MVHDVLTTKEIIKKYLLVSPIFVFVILGTLFSMTVTLAEPYFLGLLIDKGLLVCNYQAFSLFLGLLIFLFVFEKGISYFVRVYTVKLHFQSAFSLNMDLIRHVQKLPLKFFYKTDAVYLSNRINDDSQDVINFVLDNLISSLVNIFLLIVILGLFYFEGILYAVSLIFAASLYVISYFLFGRVIFEKALFQKEAQNHFFSDLNRLLADIKFLKINALAEYFNTRVITKFKDVLLAVINYTKVIWIYDSIGDVVKYGYLFAFVYVGGMSVFRGTLQVGEFVVLVSYIKIFFDNISTLLVTSKEWKKMSSSLSRINELYLKPSVDNGETTLEVIKSIAVENISFSFEDRVLYKNFSVNFNQGHIYCIVGPNGKGKSTLLLLLIGLLKPQSGTIKYNGQDIKELNLDYIKQQCIAFSEQEPLLINGSLVENFFLGKEITNEIILSDYIQYLDLDVLTEDYHKGLQYVYDDETSSLSGGEKQKISHVRNLLKGASVIIFDEPTAALDEKSKKRFIELLLKVKINKIIIIVTHDNSIKSNADYIINLESG